MSTLKAAKIKNCDECVQWLQELRFLALSEVIAKTARLTSINRKKTLRYFFGRTFVRSAVLAIEILFSKHPIGSVKLLFHCLSDENENFTAKNCWSYKIHQ